MYRHSSINNCQLDLPETVNILVCFRDWIVIIVSRLLELITDYITLELFIDC